MPFLERLFLALIPIFVAMDAVGVLPIFISLTEGFSTWQVRQTVWQSIATASLVSVGFIFLGQGIFSLLGITVADFQVAGGILLLVISITDIITSEKERRRPLPSAGPVPLGVPLIVGPAVLTTLLMLIPIYGVTVTLLALGLNLLLAAVAFLNAHRLTSFIGPVGTKAISKVVSLFLAAIAVMMIRRGIVYIISHVQ
ncbi:MAG: MarC family protein [Candidatus Latescibacteria bacterium]|nr:MarC family protein [Candidatus Latescibacterota bacterium]